RAITTPLTFAATANAVVYQGARPVFADIDATTLNLDPDAVKRVATPRTRVVLPVDFAGLPCAYDRLLPLAREHDWIVIADAAHSLGGTYGGRPVGALADMTTLSFHPAKLITTGEGGAVLTDREDLAERLRTMRHHGLLYLHPIYRERFNYGPGLCPVAESVVERLLTLPLFRTMTLEDQDDVLRALDKVFAHYAR